LYLEQLQSLAFEVQQPILENWGFDGNCQGAFDMTCTLRRQSDTSWMQLKLERCFSLLYGEAEGEEQLHSQADIS